MNKRTKSLQITPKIKECVFNRDNGKCVICGQNGLPEAHYIPRSKGGLGIEQNIVTLCRKCHFEMDNTTNRKWMLKIVKNYLDEQYPNFEDSWMVYDKNR